MTAAMDNESVMVFRDVVKVSPLPAGDVLALDGVSFRVERGEFISVMGPSGSGKSTLLNLMGCLDNPTAGDIFISGTRVGDMSDVELTNLRRDRIGFIFQTFNLIPVLTAYALSKVKPRKPRRLKSSAAIFTNCCWRRLPVPRPSLDSIPVSAPAARSRWSMPPAKWWPQR